ncbi:trk system potassium uptake protein TrkH [Secundilactobacillus oryzae JCM 18671]|uniref:Trk system potassium uptake protein TrkH n=1 Tax=Secundilactobacillus oryzae JCM 18671 TaxID=1291743 RepID=A0A081BJY8_9LACO|nr:TrkH family potassium uptake protein [Secundilactobacillus oryzae]GAK48356.1 trk system potassium uptake protein TrkH [Secundilactobacillus oryzae JCM 18671]
MQSVIHRRFSLSQTLTYGFVTIILLGTILLMLPISTNSGNETPFLTAFFTATSATCITGLTLVNTAVHWSLFGKIVIIILVELGGLGFMTFAVLLFLFMRRKLALTTQLLAKESLNLHNLSQVRIVRWIIILSLAIQLVGTGLLFVDFYPRFGLLDGIGYSIFHSISAFCNAGFDLFGNSLISFQNDPYVLTVMAVLIIAGSFGFLVWQDLLLYAKTRHLSLHTKLALRMGTALILLSLLVYFIAEQNFHFDQNGSTFDRIINTIFMAITPRTAGFVTVPYNHLSMASILFTMVLMFIGGTPGSTAGGIKTTTVGLLLIQSWATLKGDRDAEFGHRRFTQENISRALTLVFVALVILGTAIIILTFTEHVPKGSGLEYIVFEALAAFGTTGISLGLTAHLTVIGKLIIIALMFIGRVGIYTVMFSILNADHPAKGYRYPEESVLIG